MRRHPYLFLVALTLALAAIAGAWVLIQRGQRSLLRAEGLAAAQQREDERAVDLLGRYVSQSRRDVDAVYHYALARARVPLARERHLEEAIGQLKWAKGLAPNRSDIRRALAETLVAAGMHGEAEMVVQQLRRSEPNAPEHVYLQLTATAGRGDYRRAIELLDELMAMEPDRLDRHTLRLLLMKQAGQPADTVREYADRVAGSTPDAMWRLTLRNAGRVLTGQVEEARSELNSAGDLVLRSASDARALIMVLEQAALPERILESLGSWPGLLADRDLSGLYARRLWQGGRLDEFHDHIQRAGLLSGSADWEMRLLCALADKARGTAAAPAESSQPATSADPPSRRWSRLIAHVAGGRDEPSRQAQLCRSVLEIAPSNIYVQHLLAVAYFQLGEYDLSVRTTAEVTRRSPLWYAPWLLHAESQLAAGHLEAAHRAARSACALAPGSVAAAATLARIRFLQVDTGQDGDLDAVLAMMDGVREAAPNEPLFLLPRAALMARKGLRGDAGGRPEGTDFAEPEPVAARLVSSAQAPTGRVQQAEDPARRAELHQCMELADAAQPEHRKRWIALAAKYSNDMEIQSQALRAPALREDPETQAVILERLRRLLPPESLLWRMARSRWLLAWGKGDRDFAEAALLLRESIRLAPGEADARLLLAESLARLKDPAGAMEQLITAARLDSAASPLAMLILADLHRRRLAGDASRVVAVWCMLAESLPSARGRDPDRKGAYAAATIPSLELLAAAAEARGDRVLAAAAYRRLLALNPAHDAALNNLADILRRSGETRREALALARRAVAARPGVSAYWETLADTVESMGDPAIAAKALEWASADARLKVGMPPMFLQRLSTLRGAGANPG